MEEWSIQTRHLACSSCKTDFVDRQDCCTVLIQTSAGFERRDYCQPCWDHTETPSHSSKESVVSFWRGTFEPPAPPPPEPLPKEDAESLLRRMLERPDPSEFEARYILAVMLERKRILKLRETQNSERPLLIYELTRTGEVFVIEDPQLHLDRIAEVQRKVSAMLAGDSTRTLNS